MPVELKHREHPYYQIEKGKNPSRLIWALCGVRMCLWHKGITTLVVKGFLLFQQFEISLK